MIQEGAIIETIEMYLSSHWSTRHIGQTNINNVLWGYDEDRIFSLIGIAGVNLAGTKGVDKTIGAPGI